MAPASIEAHETDRGIDMPADVERQLRLIMPAAIDHLRTAWPWQGGPLVRLHCGLADASDLIADLDEGFAAMAKALG